MACAFDPVKKVYPGRQTWRLKVTIERMWGGVFPLDEPAKPFSIEMVLLDSEGVKVQASIRRPMLKKFKDLVVEGEVYKMYFFGVVRNLDCIGVLTAVYAEKRSVRDGRTTRVVQMELLDDK
ncbi:Nucleic acid-binding, OB-fold [Sesbania bispinosa]|nr:Nucleic acid-binding, OB-fold [Sesbania bispinosa]